MSSEISTDAARDQGFKVWHVYLLLAMAGATAAVAMSPNTHPAALLLLSAAIIAAGFAGTALHHALAGFFGGAQAAPPSDRVRASLPHVDATWFAVGAQAPLNCGGGPRVLLAYLDDEQRRLALSLELPKRAGEPDRSGAALARGRSHPGAGLGAGGRRFLHRPDRRRRADLRPLGRARRGAQHLLADLDRRA